MDWRTSNLLSASHIKMENGRWNVEQPQVAMHRNCHFVISWEKASLFLLSDSVEQTAERRRPCMSCHWHWLWVPCRSKELMKHYHDSLGCKDGCVNTNILTYLYLLTFLLVIFCHFLHILGTGTPVLITAWRRQLKHCFWLLLVVTC